MNDTTNDLYLGYARMPLDKEIVRVIKALEKFPRQKKDLVSEGISEKDIDKALKQEAIETWSAFLDNPDDLDNSDEPLLYVADAPSADIVEKIVESNMAQMHLDDIVLEIIKNRKLFGSRFKGMLKFLQDFDSGKLKYWTPLTFYEILSHLYETGKLKETDIAPLLDIVEESKSLLVDEVDIKLTNAKTLVNLNLLSLVDKEAELYRYGYCSFLEETFRKQGIDYAVLIEKEFDKLSKKQKKILKELDVLEDNKLTTHGEMILDYLCKCGFDPKNRDEELKKMIAKLKSLSEKEPKSSLAAKYLLKAARIQGKMGDQPSARETLALASRKFSEGITDSLRLNSGKYESADFIELYKKINGRVMSNDEDLLKEFKKDNAHALSGILLLRIAREHKIVFDMAFRRYAMCRLNEAKERCVNEKSKGMDKTLAIYREAIDEFVKADKLFLASGLLSEMMFFSDKEYGILVKAYERANARKSPEAGRLEDVLDSCISLSEVVKLGEDIAPKKKEIEAEFIREKTQTYFEREVLKENYGAMFKDFCKKHNLSPNESDRLVGLQELNQAIDDCADTLKADYSKIKDLPEIRSIKIKFDRFAELLGYERMNVLPDIEVLKTNIRRYVNERLDESGYKEHQELQDTVKAISEHTKELDYISRKRTYNLNKVNSVRKQTQKLTLFMTALKSNYAIV